MRPDPVRAVLAVTLLAAASIGPARAQPPDLAALFPQQAAVRAEAGRYVRLALPAAVLEACRPDLSDLRIFDSRDREVPYAIDRGDDAVDGLTVVRTVAVRLVDADRRTEGGEGGTPPSRSERLGVIVPAAAREGAWQLVLATSATDWTRRLTVSAPGPDDTDIVLVDDRTVFRLTSPPRQRLRVALPSLRDLPGDTLRIDLAGQGAGYLEPSVRFEQVRHIAERPHVDVPLTEISRQSVGGTTTIVLARPAGIVPDALRIETDTTAFDRDLAVWDEGPGRHDLALGRARLARHPGTATEAARDVAVTTARGDRLRVVIDDGDSPPLDSVRVLARLHAPALLFALPETGEGTAAATLRFGGARAHRPRYDPVVLGGSDREGGSAERGRYLPGDVGLATLGPVEPNPRHDPEPALAFAFAAGAPLDARSYRHRRRLEARPSADGLVRMALDPEMLSALAPGLADLRIVDSAGAQRPYLIGPGEPEWQELGIVFDHRDGQSTFDLVPPVAPARFDQLSLAPDAAFVDRNARLRGTPSGGGPEVTLFDGPIRLALGDPRPWRIDLPDIAFERLTLIVDDGDDAPLTFRRVAGRFATVDLGFAAPAGTYSLLFGDAEALPPRYEIEQLHDLVFALEAGTATLGPVEANPAYRAISSLRGAGWQRLVLWVVMAAAVLVLATLTLRLARQEGIAS